MLSVMKMAMVKRYIVLSCLKAQINENINLYPFKLNGYRIHYPGQLKI